jgi:hypothetical protein
MTQCVSISHWGLFAVEQVGVAHLIVVTGFDENNLPVTDNIKYHQTVYRPLRYNEDIEYKPFKYISGICA